MTNTRKIAVGILATALVIVISLGFISLFSFPLFTGWVSYALLCLIPMEIVASVTWGTKHPGFAGSLGQPAKGVAFVTVCLVTAAIVGPLQYAMAGRFGGPPTPSPMLVMCTIVSVIITFWLAIMWGGWPFTAMIKSPVAAGLALLATCYLVNYALFRVFFNYEFMKGAPVYVPALDPHGMFNAWDALVFYLTVIMIMFVTLHFDLWPFTKSAGLMKQPALGMVWTLVSFALGGAIFYVGVAVLRMDVVSFMITVPVPFIFGTIVGRNMLQGSLFGNAKQPVKGILHAASAAVIGTLLAFAYHSLAPIVTGTLKPGPPSYDYEIWLASALLGVTFPFLIFHAEFFKLWPLQKQR
jgi:hypothetical protein